MPARLLVGIAACLLIWRVAGTEAQADRLGPWNQPTNAFLAPTITPDNVHSFLALQDGNFTDSALAGMVFTNANTRINNYFDMQFEFEACCSGGFVGALGATNGLDANPIPAAMQRPNVGVMTATSWNRPSFFGNESYFPQGVSNGFQAGDSMLDSFKAGSDNVRTNVGLGVQPPQYWSASARVDNKTMQTAAGINDLAFLVVNPDDKNTELEFWNDLMRLHGIMVNQYGWTDAPGSQHEIVALFADGTPPAGQPAVNWLDGAATAANLSANLTRLHNNSGNLSFDYFFFGSHGGSVVPEPPSLLVLGTGIVALIGLFRVRGGFRRRLPSV